MNSWFPSENHGRPCPVLDGGLCPGREGGGAQRFPSSWVPTFGSGNAEGAPQVAATEGDGKRRKQFHFVSHFQLGGEYPRLGTGMAKSLFTGEPVDAAV